MKNLLDKVILVGINFMNAENQLVEQYQTSGIIVSVKNNILTIKRENLPDFQLPYDEEAMKTAAPGFYRERSTGKTIENPDLIAQWRVNNVIKERIVQYKNHGFQEFKPA